MTTMLAITKQQGLRLCGWLAACALAATAATAQTPAPSPRIRSEISASAVTALKYTPRPFVTPRYDVGRMPADTGLTGVTLLFNRTAAQQADLQALMAAQQNPSSPLFHKWLTPEQFGARFGMAQTDLDKVEQWLQQQGFVIDEVGRARGFIRFSGTANQVELAFQTQMHYYKGSDGVQHISPSTALSVPAAIAPTIESIQGLTDLRPRPMHIAASRRANPDFTFVGGDNNQHVFFAPGDIKIAYDINSVIQGGADGTGQTIAVMGQSKISTTDITNFQNAAGLTVKAPTLTLVPNTGTAAFSAGDEGESDLDLEWAGAIAPGATINFVYTGNTSQNGVFDSLTYAIDNQIGNILTVSYGACELALGGFNQEMLYQQAATQGQTIIASAGDTGSTACLGYSGLTTTQQQSLAVNYPSSSQYVTGVGGTEISATNAAVGPYWSAAPTTGNEIALTTALSYIPETAWNDDTLSGTASAANGGGLSASTGGASTLYTSKPTWQTGVAGIPSDGKRDVPDVALYSSPNYPGYLYCTSDSSDWASGQTASCGNNQFYAATGTAYFTAAGGDSFAAPIFAAMVAIINQKAGYTTGQGFINPKLYQLASNATTYASAFHDVTVGNNYCTAGTTYGFCSAGGTTEGFAAGVGYDQVTGLGSVDVTNLAAAWPSATLASSTVTLADASTTVATGATDAIAITVAPASNTVTTTPTGTVTVTVDGVAQPTPLTLSSGSATYTYTGAAVGPHLIAVSYSGDGTFATSTASTTVTVIGGGTTATTTTLSATSTTPTYGASTTITAAVAPSAATGEVLFYDGGVEVGSGVITSGSATFSSSTLIIGTHTFTATYYGDTTYASSTSAPLTVTVSAPANLGAYTLTATNITVTQGSSGVSTITVTPSGGYTGTVTIAPTNSDSNVSLCYTAATANVTSTTAATGSLTIDTNLTDCGATNNSVKSGAKHLFVAGKKVQLGQTHPFTLGSAALGLAGIFFGLLGLRQRRLRVFFSIVLLAGIAFTLTACGGGGGGGSSNSNYTTKGTYNLTVTGTDSVGNSVSTTLTLKVQ